MSQIEAAPTVNQQMPLRYNSLISNDQNDDLERVLDEPAQLHKKTSEPMLEEGGQQLERKNESTKFIHNHRIYSVSQKTTNEQSDSSQQQQGYIQTENNPKVVLETLTGPQKLHIHPLKTSHKSFNSFTSQEGEQGGGEEEGEDEEEEHSPEIQLKLAKHSNKELIVGSEKRTSKSTKSNTDSLSQIRTSRMHAPLRIQQSQNDKTNQSSEIHLQFPQQSQIPEQTIESISKSKKPRQMFQGKKKNTRWCKPGVLLIQNEEEEDKEDLEIVLKESVHKDIGQIQLSSQLLSPYNLRTSSSGVFSDRQGQETQKDESIGVSDNKAITEKKASTNNGSSFNQDSSNIMENHQIIKNNNINLLRSERNNKNNGNLQEIASAFDNENTQTTEQEEEEDDDCEHYQLQILEQENDQEQLDIKQNDEIADMQKNIQKQDQNELNADIQDQQYLSQRKSQGVTETVIKEEGEITLNSQQLFLKDYSFQSPRVKQTGQKRTKSNPTTDSMQYDYQYEGMIEKGQDQQAYSNQNILASNMNKNENSRQQEFNKCEDQTVNLTLIMEGNLKQDIPKIDNRDAAQSMINNIQNDNSNNNNDGSQQTIEPMSVQKKYNSGMRLEGRKNNSNENSINSAETINLYSATKNFGDSKKKNRQDHEEMPEVIEYTKKKEQPQEAQDSGVLRLNFQQFKDNELGGNLNRSENRTQTQGGYLVENEDKNIREHHVEVIFNSDQRNKESIAAGAEEKGREHERSIVLKLQTEGEKENKIDNQIIQNEEIRKNTLTSPLNNSFEFTQYWGELRQQIDQQFREQSCLGCLKLMWPQKLTSSQQKEKYLILALSEENYNDSKPQNACLLEQVRLLFRKFTSSNKKMTLIMNPDETRKRIERRETCGGILFSKDTNMQVSEMNIFALVQMFLFLSCEQAQQFAVGSRRLLRKVNLLFLLMRISNIIATKIKENILDGCLQQSTDEFIVLSKELYKSIYSEAVVPLLEVTLEPNETNVKLYDNVDKIAKRLNQAKSVISFLKDSIENQRFFGKTRNIKQNNTNVQHHSFNKIPAPTAQIH